VQVRKPVLYVHLPSDTDEVTFDATSMLPDDGEIREHWPLTRLEAPDRVTWCGVTARRGTCAGLTYPAVGTGPCARVQDGYCEVAELGAYETSDGACLHFGGAVYDHLFYRGTNGIASPVSVTVEGQELTLGGTAAGPVLQIERAADRVRTRVAVHPLPAQETAHIRVPIEIEEGGGADAGRRFLVERLTELGLTEPERDAFLRAWDTHLFGTERAAPSRTPVQSGQTPRVLAPVTHALLYFLPADELDHIATLSFEPAPRAIRRAMAVLVDLSI
jgi:hypothetical protein